MQNKQDCSMCLQFNDEGNALNNEDIYNNPFGPN